MKVDEQLQVMELTRRNLLTLLAKLDGSPPNSACALVKDGWLVRAVEDDAHYSDREHGFVHPATLRAIGLDK